MQSTALALMSCANKLLHEGRCRKFDFQYTNQVPIYDAILFCDLGLEPSWVMNQVYFIQQACEWAEIPFYILKSNLFEDYMNDFGKKRVVSIPFWSVDETGKKGKMMRNCTLDYKIALMQNFVRWNLLGYKKGKRTKTEDLKAHEMHLGFSKEEEKRCSENPHKMFVNKFPLVEMNLERKDNYAYIRDIWGLETKASACTFCPFHRNYFFQYIKKNDLSQYEDLIEFDNMLEREQPNTKINSKLYISRSRKRIAELVPEECEDAEHFMYRGEKIWNGF
ncbi:hypothetical protein [uncultured Robinsoniella sp.]|uniref:hypothetical protein n=1 Tax=uncultured Robinsoniella sp. TaxID=904190 RepID=UPI00204C5D1E|nr:MAG TPA: ANH-like nucleotide alpha hydrolase family protein [Caudoviricetes sp.]